jgi:uncharacterized protein with HEPN domain
MSTPDSLERDLVKCEDMRIRAERAREHLGSRSPADFRADSMAQDAVIRCVEVVGEAARLVSEDTRRRAPEIPWPLITGMRHVLAHDYGDVDLDMVYRVAAEHIPALLTHLRALIAALERDVGWREGDDR